VNKILLSNSFSKTFLLELILKLPELLIQ